jgi:hypothetical protein
MPFVFAFIAFNILDLDGSNLASLTRCFERSVVDADLAASSCLDPPPQRFEYFDDEQILTANDSPDRARCRTAQLRSLSRLEKARSHLYHVSLPRDAVPG